MPPDTRQPGVVNPRPLRVMSFNIRLGLVWDGRNRWYRRREIVFDVMRLPLDAELPGTGRSVEDVLLEPTRIYVRPVLSLLDRVPVRAMAHITGGGLTGNLPRVLPPGCRAVLRRAAWPVPPVFETLRRAGQVADREMFRTFNMGIGYVLVVPPAEGAALAALTALQDLGAVEIGEIVAGERGVELA